MAFDGAERKEQHADRADDTAPEPANPPAGDTADTPTAAVNEWQFWSLIAVLITLVAILAGAFALKPDSESTTAILGATLPSFATIAAAIFGIKAVYESGKSTGEATAKAEGEKDKAKAVEDAQSEAARVITKPLRGSQPDAARELVGRIRLAGESAPGNAGFKLFGPDPAQPIELSDDLLSAVEARDPQVGAALAAAEAYLK